MIALTALRAELNRECAYIRAMKVNLDKGFNVRYSTKTISGIKWQNVVAIRKAIKKINNIRPVYKWDYVTI
jgi:hypothetical protein